MIEREKNISVLKGIPFEIDEASLGESLRIRAGSEEEAAFKELVEKVRETANPKAIYRTCFVDCVNGDEVTIDGVRFESRLLSKKLHSVGRVFPFVITSGRELYEYPIDRADFLKIFLWDSLLEHVLHEAAEFMRREISRNNLIENLVWMSPGSGDAEIWPLQQQKELFSLIGNVKEEIGVELKESLLMIPTKSISGIAFRSKKDYRSCMVCRRVNCHYRSAPYDEKLRNSLE